VRGWVILIGTFLVGAVVGAGVAQKGSGLVAGYLPRAVGAPGQRLEGPVVRKQRDGNRLLVKVSTPQGPMLATFTEKVADLDVLLDSGDTVTLLTRGYTTFVEDPVLERVKEPPRAPAPSVPPTSPPATPLR
jgi:hypothetical protein